MDIYIYIIIIVVIIIVIITSICHLEICMAIYGYHVPTLVCLHL